MTAARMTAARDGAPLLRVDGLRVTFTGQGASVTAVNDVSFELGRGEVLCLLGESGCGKTVMMRSLIRLLPPQRTKIDGRISFEDQDVAALSRKGLDALRGRRIAMVFQDPLLALDPVYTIGEQLVEAIRCHERIGASEARGRSLALLDSVHVPSPRRVLDSYPHQLSGGMAQRAMIALALCGDPTLLLADEPTTALDATVQIQILVLLREVQRRTGMSVILVTHDIGVAAELADRVAVMYAGRIVEIGSAVDILRAPRHPYTRGLLASTSSGLARGERLRAIPGAPPDLGALPAGCSFADRCDRAVPACRVQFPPLIAQAGGRAVACLLETTPPTGG
jgi:peptide/nickel transport system ATP-binding protein